MKRYIFLTPSITNVGGAQMYLKSKSIWLTKKGYDVIIISSQTGKCGIKDLKIYQKFVINGISHLPDFYYGKKIERIINKLQTIIDGDSDEIVIESTSITIAVWGELLAKKYNAKHLVYSLQEKNEIYNEDYLHFLEFKNKRRELAGITSLSIPRMFNLEYEDEKLCLKAYSSNEPEDSDHFLINKIKKADFTIGSLGRLDKPFVIPMINEIIKFAKKHKNMSFNLLLIGGADNRIEEKIINKLVRKNENIRLYITGFVYPIPLKLIQMADVFISSSGSCFITAQQKRLTISVDGNDYKPIGIYGITTNNFLFRSNESPIDLCDLLHKILIENQYNPSLIEDVSTSVVDYHEHMDFITKSSKTKEYYSFQEFHSVGKFKKIFFNIIGSNLYTKLHYFKKNVFSQRINK